MTVSGTGAPAGFAGTNTYQYDGHDQLKNEQSTRAGGYTNAFNYDAAGNPTTFRGVDPTGGKGYTPDNQNAAYTFDKDGNPTSWTYNKTNQALTFDAGNHVTAIGSLLTAGYNADGLRAWKQSAAGSTYYVYDGLTPVVELDGNGNVTAVNTWGAAGLAGRHTTAGSGSSTFYTFDVQGSVSQRLSANGTVQGTYGFDSYGMREGTDNSADPYSGFGAQWGYLRDGETGLSLCGERYYDPGQGRFLNRDPIGYGGGLNVYAYVGSNPLGDVDPDGLAKVEVRYKLLGSPLGVSYYHAYIVVTDPNGSVYYIRGGPDGDPEGAGPICGASSGSSSQSSGRYPGGSSRSSNSKSHSANSSSPGASRGGNGKNNGPFGPIVSTSGSYTPTSPDYQTGKPPSSLIANDNRPASYYMQQFKRTGQQITDASIPYNPFTTNSNAFVREVLKDAGLAPPKPPVWVPGWEVDLPYK